MTDDIKAKKPKYQDSLRGYGYLIMKRDDFICQYCGYDGRSFNHWLQLTIDHILPARLGGGNDEANLVAACQYCNSATSRMTFEKSMKLEDIVKEKKRRVHDRRNEYHKFWTKNVKENASI